MEPNLRERYEEFQRLGFIRNERNHAMLRERSTPWSPPDSGGGTGKSDTYIQPYVDAGYLEWRTLGDKDPVLSGFCMETEMGRRFEIEHPDRDGDGDYDLTVFFWNVLGVHKDPTAFVDNPGFTAHWHRQYVSPLGVLRRSALVKKNPEGEFQWTGPNGEFLPFPELDQVLTAQGSSAGKPR